jgi:UDP-2,3-diacylglucosamine pyrophosphatase LpxH
LKKALPKRRAFFIDCFSFFLIKTGSKYVQFIFLKEKCQKDIMNFKEIRTIWVSDLHIGTSNFQAAKFLKFLKEFEVDGRYTLETLYLVGDIVDFMSLGKRRGWNPDHTIVIQKLLRMSRKGTRIIWIQGNHDEGIEFLNGWEFGNIIIKTEDYHVMQNGKKILIIHGHQADGLVLRYPFLYWLGDSAYEFSVFLNRIFNKMRLVFGLEYWSLSMFLKGKVKQAVNFVSRANDFLIKETKKKECKVLISGHSHWKLDIEIDEIRVLNCGCWTEYCSFLYETSSGKIGLENY